VFTVLALALAAYREKISKEVGTVFPGTTVNWHWWTPDMPVDLGLLTTPSLVSALVQALAACGHPCAKNPAQVGEWFRGALGGASVSGGGASMEDVLSWLEGPAAQLGGPSSSSKPLGAATASGTAPVTATPSLVTTSDTFLKETLSPALQALVNQLQVGGHTRLSLLSVELQTGAGYSYGPELKCVVHRWSPTSTTAGTTGSASEPEYHDVRLLWSPWMLPRELSHRRMHPIVPAGMTLTREGTTAAPTTAAGASASSTTPDHPETVLTKSPLPGPIEWVGLAKVCHDDMAHPATAASDDLVPRSSGSPTRSLSASASPLRPRPRPCRLR
jgi:hypothetical protein